MRKKLWTQSTSGVFVGLLVLVFFTELLLMVAFDFLPPSTPVWLLTLLDPLLLTMIVAVSMWLLYIKPTAESLSLEIARSRAITDAAAESIVTIDESGLVESFNPAAEKLFGYSEAEIVGTNVNGLMPVRHARQHDGYLAHYLRTGEKRIIGSPREVLARHRHGALIPVELNVAEISFGGQRHFVGIFRDITERKAAEERIQRMAHFDALTDLPNRALFYDRLQQAISMARREKQELAICYLDLDGFKAVNDTLGHDSGDELLRNVASRLRRAVRGSDTVARLGGDEFAVILPHIASRNDAAQVAVKIIEAIRAPFQMRRGMPPVEVGVSVGVVFYPVDSEDMDELVRCADSAMYRAKQTGNRFEFADAT